MQHKAKELSVDEVNIRLKRNVCIGGGTTLPKGRVPPFVNFSAIIAAPIPWIRNCVETLSKTMQHAHAAPRTLPLLRASLR